MKKYLQVMVVFILLIGVTKAQTIFEENFNYTVGSLLTANGYTVSSGTTNALTVTSPGLTFSGYPPASGNATTLATTGEDVYRTFSSQKTGSVYLSFLMNVQTAQATGDYFIALSPTSSQTNYYARTHLKSSGNGYLIGLSKSNELTGGYVYGTTVLNFNTTYLVVVKHSFLGTAADSTNDTEQVFVISGTIPSTEPTSSEIAPYTQTTKTDPKDLGYVTIRQGSSSAAATLKLDGIRIMTSWASLVTAVKDNSTNLPINFDLSQNYPNPFNPSTVISYQLPVAGHVSLKVFDMLGREVVTLIDEFKQAGKYNSQFSILNLPAGRQGSQLSSGIYFYTIQAGNFTQTKKMILMK